MIKNGGFTVNNLYSLLKRKHYDKFNKIRKQKQGNGVSILFLKSKIIYNGISIYRQQFCWKSFKWRSRCRWFWAEWCGPCRLIGPIIEELSSQYDGKAVIGKVNVDENPEISMKYSIRSIPTILILKDGEVVDKQVGLTTKAALEAKILPYL